jgi:hypothetical protein
MKPETKELMKTLLTSMNRAAIATGHEIVLKHTRTGDIASFKELLDILDKMEIEK